MEISESKIQKGMKEIAIKLENIHNYDSEGFVNELNTLVSDLDFFIII
jgi:hypothetical protein